MKWTLLVVLCIVALFDARAQKHLFTDKVSSQPLVNIASEEVNKMFTPPPAQSVLLKSASEESAQINVVYVDFPEEAKNAFQYAISIWEDLITTSVPIDILARWEKLEGNTLAYGVPSQFYKNFDGALVPDVYYPVALVEKLSGKDWSGKDADIACGFNKNIAWYFGTDGNTPDDKYDFVTAVLHEITHGLGFSGFFKAESGSAFFSNSANLPSIYDYYVFNFNNQRIADANNFSRPSDELLVQLTSQKLKFQNEEELTKSGVQATYLFAPTTWQEGSSLYHLSKSETNGNGDSNLMAAYKYKGEAIHSPGENTMKIISELGWNSLSFKFEQIRDFEQTCSQLPVQIAISGEAELNTSSVKIVYSKDYFTTCDSINLSFDKSNNHYEGNIALNNFTGNVQYYFEARTGNKKYTLPSFAPSKKYSFRVGTDYSVPTIQHNPIQVVSSSEKSVNFSATADDNLGVNSVAVEYILNGTVQKPVNMQLNSQNVFVGVIPVPGDIEIRSMEYRIVANDASKNKNQVSVPSSGYYSVNVFEPLSAVTSYQSDFDSDNNDFMASGFEISRINGFSDGMMHTLHPYPVSVLEKENYNLISQLKYPVIIENGGKITFDEIVLVELGEPNSTFTDGSFYDYVIVEGSKDNGKTWIPVTEGYDSGVEDEWENTLKSSLVNNTLAAASEEMLIKRTIDLTNKTGFYEGDTVIFRFRLSSDNSVNGWGWAIDNLKIQEVSSENKEIVASGEIDVYPNPFSGNFYIDCTNVPEVSTVDIKVTDLTGKTVFSEIWSNTQYSPKKQVNLSDIKPGIYLVCMAADHTQTITKKIVKY